MRKITIKQRLQYQFDNLMARGTSAMLLGLLTVSAIIVVVAAAIVAISQTAPNKEGFLQLLWMAFMREMDSGTVAGDTGSWFFILMMLLVTFGGIFILSALIGILNTGLEERLEQMRKGRSLVLESGHTLILGWNPQVFTIISELVAANANRQSGAAIVILADEDKVVMEDAIRERIPDTANTRVVCRSGSPVDLTDLEIANPHEARSIIILAQGDDPDTDTIKAVLALTNNPDRREEPYHIVAQLRQASNVDIVRMIGTCDTVLPTLSTDIIARVAAQTSRQSGLSQVYTELLDFGGDEIYFAEKPKLVGRTYGDSLAAYEDCSVIGIGRKDGTVLVNPSMDLKFEPGDRVIAIAEDDDKIIMSDAKPPSADDKAIVAAKDDTKTKPERVLILGWNQSGPVILRELDNYVASGSEATVVSDLEDVASQVRHAGVALKNQKLRLVEGDIRDRALLEELGAADYDHVIVLAYSHLGAQEADAVTLVVLLHLRDIAERDETPFSIVSEMLDVRNRELAEATKVDDFIVSDHILSLLMTQLSENADLAHVFEDIFEAEGSEIYLKPVTTYVKTGRPVDFYTVLEAARRRGESAIGYRIMAESRDAAASYGVRTNPPKSEKIIFSPDDRVIVLAED